MSRLKELRRERGYTQIKMQHLTGIDQSDYSKIEIALALNTSMDYLAGLTDVKDAYPRKPSNFSAGSAPDNSTS